MPHTKEYHRDWKRNKMEVLRADPVAWTAHQKKKAEYDTKYRAENQERRRVLALNWSRRPDVKEKLSQRASAYYLKNKDQVSARNKEWMDKNRVDWNKKQAQKRKALQTKSPHLYLLQNMRWKMSTIVRGIAIGDECMRLIGCTPEFFKKHIESQFHDGMTWANYGRRGWHLDHVKPISHFNFKLESERAECFHYTNVQPMWESENCSKGNRRIYRVMERVLSA